ncbi:hypothetical protein GF327_03590 [Candidatus Woesearchaeota archaeon]|nr:hypothetical protein [Candidatus Woesearchaeota archaeon]
MSKVLSIDLKRDELNTKFGGGIPRNSLILVEGEDGAGKSILAQRISYGLIEQGHTVTYISTELDTLGFVKQMSSIKYKVTDYLLDDKYMFIPMFPYYGNAELDENFMEKLFSTEKLFEKEIIIFDTLSFLIIQENISHKQTFDLIQFVKKINSLEKTLIFCVDPDHLNERFLTLLRSVCDVYFNLEIKMVLGNLLRIINVRRFRRSRGEVTTAIPFKVLPNVGLAIELASLS